jgi:light-regulated signal transduction histidine kinase (bacteriophytochrome)
MIVTLPEQFSPQFLSEAFKQLIIHTNAIINFSLVMLESKEDPLNKLQETDLCTLKNSAQTLLDSINNLLKLDFEQVVSFVVDENLQAATVKLFLKADFLPRLKHDLTTPVNSIIGFSRVLLKGLDGSITETQKTYLTDINENGQKSFQILQQIFNSWDVEDIVDNTTLNCKEINLKQMIDRFVNWVKKYGEAEIVVENGIDDLFPIWSDEIRFHSIIHFTTSALSKRFMEGKITFKADLSGEVVIISIKNENFTFLEFTIEEFEQVRADTLLSSIPPISLFNETFDLCIGRLLVEMLGGEIHLEKVETASIITFALPIKNSQFQGAI